MIYIYLFVLIILKKILDFELFLSFIQKYGNLPLIEVKPYSSFRVSCNKARWRTSASPWPSFSIVRKFDWDDIYISELISFFL